MNETAKALIAAGLAALTASVVSAADYSVTPASNDANTGLGLSEGQALRTIQAAAEKLQRAMPSSSRRRLSRDRDVSVQWRAGQADHRDAIQRRKGGRHRHNG